ncbi:MAG: PLP-dependent aminotransferase family protein [Butyrivibrio sp.]|nr:PLP-dependent aminotransferase family protein [Butyrivibrio sp.]
MVELHVTLSGQGNLYEQIYESIRTEIREGRLRRGEQLPSARLLAQFLSVSRATVDLAYDQLSSEGYIEAVPRRGYFVCDLTGNEPGRVLSPYGLPDPVPSAGEETAPVTDPDTVAYDFSPRKIEMASFPYATWRRLNRNVLVGERMDLFALGGSQGDLPLRETIAHELALARDVRCVPEQVVLGAGSDYLLLILARILGHARIGMEPLTYLRAAQVLGGEGMTLLPVGMDENGMLPGALSMADAELAYVMPSHQYPTGVVMPVARRLELLEWAAAQPGRYLIEDDYDSAFRYRGRPFPSLHSQDGGRHVIYLGTFSKTIAPAIRISYMVLPFSLLEVYRQRCACFACTVTRVDQAVLEDFLREGAYGRHLNRMRRTYRQRHDALLEALEPFMRRFTVSGSDAGLHLLLSDRHADAAAQKPAAAEQALAQAAAEQGVRVYPLRENALPASADAGIQKGDAMRLPAPLRSPTMILGFASLTPDEIRRGCECLRMAWSV